MSFLKKKKVHGIPLLLLVALAVCTITVSAAFYVILQFTSTATVATNPKVCFFNWTDANTKLNTFTMETYNIFPSTRTINENISFGVWNWDSSSHTCYIRVYSLTNTGNIDYLNLTIHNGGQLFSEKWTDFSSLPTSWSTSFDAAATTRYSIWWEVNATSSASGSSTFIIDMKVEEP